MHQQWRVVVATKEGSLSDQTIELSAPRILTEDALTVIYNYIDLIYDNIYYFLLDYAGSPMNSIGRGKCEVFIEEGKLVSFLYEDSYKHLCNRFDKANLRNKVYG